MPTTNSNPSHIKYLPLDDISPATRNPKNHDLNLVQTSISRFGFASPALRDERTGRLVVGHGRTQALKAMRDAGQTPPSGVQTDDNGNWLVPVVCGWQSRSDAEADAYLITDNQHTIAGGWDNTELAELLADIAEADTDLLNATGYDQEDLNDLIKLATPPDLDDLADTIGEPQEGDGWPVIRFQAPPHVAAAWRSHLDTHSGNEAAAFAALLDVDPEQPAAQPWEPDLQTGKDPQ